MSKRYGASIVSRIDRRLRALAPPGKDSLSDRSASLASGLSADGIRSIRRQIESGRQKGLKSETLEKLAVGLKTTPMWLLRGEGPEEVNDDHIPSEHVLDHREKRPGNRVRVVGYVGAGSAAHYYALADEDFQEVSAPADANEHTVAVEIRGKSFGPLMDSWLAFYDDVHAPVTERLIGQICVVGLGDDRVLLKQIQREKDGSFTLLSNSSDEPIRNAKVEWAAEVTEFRKRR